jgi:hypothetical protein
MSESYMHRYAKQTLASWVRGRIRVGPKFQGLQPVGETIMLGTTSPMFGVYEEFPVTSDGVGIEKCANCSHLEACHGWDCIGTFKKKHNIPMKKELDELEIKPKYFFDVGVVNSDGNLYCVLEVCYKNPMNNDKIAWLKQHNIQWFEISAEWIMSQCHSPYSIQDGILRSS